MDVNRAHYNTMRVRNHARKMPQKKQIGSKSKPKLFTPKPVTSAKKHPRTSRGIKASFRNNEDSHAKATLNHKQGTSSLIRKHRELLRHFQKIQSGILSYKQRAKASQSREIRPDKLADCRTSKLKSAAKSKSKLLTDIKAFRKDFGKMYRRSNIRKTVSKSCLDQMHRRNQLVTLKKTQTSENTGYAEMQRVNPKLIQNAHKPDNNFPIRFENDSKRSSMSSSAEASRTKPRGTPSEINIVESILERSTLNRSQKSGQSSAEDPRDVRTPAPRLENLSQSESRAEPEPEQFHAEGSYGLGTSCDQILMASPENKQNDTTSGSSVQNEFVKNAIQRYQVINSLSQSVSQNLSTLRSKLESGENRGCVDSSLRDDSQQSYLEIRSNTVGVGECDSGRRVPGDRLSRYSSLDRSRAQNCESLDGGTDSMSGTSTIAKQKGGRAELSASRCSSRNWEHDSMPSANSSASDLTVSEQDEFTRQLPSHKRTQLSGPVRNSLTMKQLVEELVQSNRNILHEAIHKINQQSRTNILSLKQCFEEFKLGHTETTPSQAVSRQPGTDLEHSASIETYKAKVDELKQTIDQLRAANSGQAETIVRMQTQLESREEIISLKEQSLLREVRNELRSIRESFDRTLQRTAKLHEQQQGEIDWVKQQLLQQSKASIGLTSQISRLEARSRRLDLWGPSGVIQGFESDAGGLVYGQVENAKKFDHSNCVLESPQNVSNQTGQLSMPFLKRQPKYCSETVVQSSLNFGEYSRPLFTLAAKQKNGVTPNDRSSEHHPNRFRQSHSRRLSYPSTPLKNKKCSIGEINSVNENSRPHLSNFSFKFPSLNVTQSESNYRGQQTTTGSVRKRLASVDSGQAIGSVNLEAAKNRLSISGQIEIEHCYSALKIGRYQPDDWPSFSGSTRGFFYGETLDFESLRQSSQKRKNASFFRALTEQYGLPEQMSPTHVTQNFNIDYSKNVFLDSGSQIEAKQRQQDLVGLRGTLRCDFGLENRAHERAQPELVKHFGLSGESLKRVHCTAMCGDTRMGPCHANAECPNRTDYPDHPAYGRPATDRRISHEKSSGQDSQAVANIDEQDQNNERQRAPIHQTRSYGVTPINPTVSACLAQTSKSPVLDSRADKTLVDSESVVHANKQNHKTKHDLHLLPGIALEKNANRKLLEFIATHDNVSVSSFNSNSQLSDTLSEDDLSGLPEPSLNDPIQFGETTEPGSRVIDDAQTPRREAKRRLHQDPLESGQPERQKLTEKGQDRELVERGQKPIASVVDKKTNPLSYSENNWQSFGKKNGIIKNDKVNLNTKNGDLLSAQFPNILKGQTCLGSIRKRLFQNSLSLTETDFVRNKKTVRLSKAKSLTRLQITVTKQFKSLFTNVICESEICNIFDTSKQEIFEPLNGELQNLTDRGCSKKNDLSVHKINKLEMDKSNI